jgi:hypothetical protein
VGSMNSFKGGHSSGSSKVQQLRNSRHNGSSTAAVYGRGLAGGVSMAGYSTYSS